MSLRLESQTNNIVDARQLSNAKVNPAATFTDGQTLVYDGNSRSWNYDTVLTGDGGDIFFTIGSPSGSITIGENGSRITNSYLTNTVVPIVAAMDFVDVQINSPDPFTDNWEFFARCDRNIICNIVNIVSAPPTLRLRLYNPTPVNVINAFVSVIGYAH